MSRRTWLWWLLALSVAANLFFVGLWAGGRLGGDGPPHEVGRESAVLAELPPVTRQALRSAVQQARPDRQAARQARREAARILAAEPYDRAAAEAVLRTSRELHAAARARTDGALLDAAGQLDTRQRAVLSRLLQRGEGGRGERPKR